MDVVLLYPWNQKFISQKGLWWMIVQSTLSKTISTTGQKTAYDKACKKLLSEKIILAWIMKSCLPEYRDCTVQEIAEKYIEGEPQISKIAVHQDEQLETGNSPNDKRTEHRR